MRRGTPSHITSACSLRPAMRLLTAAPPLPRVPSLTPPPRPPSPACPRPPRRAPRRAAPLCACVPPRARACACAHAQTYEVHVWFVAHPRQMQNYQGEPPNLYSIAGSAHFINKADNGIVVHRWVGAGGVRVRWGRAPREGDGSGWSEGARWLRQSTRGRSRQG